MKLYHLLAVIVVLAVVCLAGAQLVTSRAPQLPTELTIRQFEDVHGRVYVVVTSYHLTLDSDVVYVVIDHENRTVEPMFDEEFNEFDAHLPPPSTSSE